jgi:hypothetical protein
MHGPPLVKLTQLTVIFVASVYAANPFPFDPGFDIAAVASAAESLPSHSWEFGAAAEALLELHNPDLSVFALAPFPVPVVNSSKIRALTYAASKITFGSGPNSLSDGQGAVGDPASLGVSAVLLGKTNIAFAVAARQTVDYMVNSAPRFWNGAISQRSNVPELWADFMYMGPPFLSYYAASTCNADLLSDAVELCSQYRQILRANVTDGPQGSWMHIIGPESQDTGLWSTGNGWAAAGMVRVLAVIIKAPAATRQYWQPKAVDRLTGYIKEIVDGAMAAPVDDNTLLRNYLNDTAADGHGYGEIAGTSLLASAVYRMAVLCPSVFGSSYIQWADSVRATLGNGKHISSNGTVFPAVNPLNWADTTPFTAGSPEGNNFVVLMYAAWRDCVQAGTCNQ